MKKIITLLSLIAFTNCANEAVDKESESFESSHKSNSKSTSQISLDELSDESSDEESDSSSKESSSATKLKQDRFGAFLVAFEK